MAENKKTPKYSFCPLCGTRLVKRKDFDQTRRHLCPGCGWVYYPHPFLSATVLICKGDKVLLVKRNQTPKKGLWQLPGGFVEFGEMPQETAVREVKEETGLKIKIEKLAHLEMIDDDPRGIILGFVYQAKIKKGKLGKDKEISAVDFFSLEKLPKIAFKIHHRLLAKKGGKIDG
ncbi:MAG TPA: NUDIX hydrolase [Candidatus Bathyarchaeia archaeon]|nr:NUDIX hydrolase [Candidatus Bathyarchaeia archaeon]